MSDRDRLLKTIEQVEEARESAQNACCDLRTSEKDTLIAKVRFKQLTEVCELLRGERTTL